MCIKAPAAPLMVGRVFRVTELSHRWNTPHWHTDPEQRCPSDGRRVLFDDNDVRPIRDPGPDAVDETLRELESA